MHLIVETCGGDQREHRGQGVYDKMEERSYLGKVFLESQQGHTAVIPVLRRQRQEDRAFEASLSYLVPRLCLVKQSTRFCEGWFAFDPTE